MSVRLGGFARARAGECCGILGEALFSCVHVCVHAHFAKLRKKLRCIDSLVYGHNHDLQGLGTGGLGEGGERGEAQQQSAEQLLATSKQRPLVPVWD